MSIAPPCHPQAVLSAARARRHRGTSEESPQPAFRSRANLLATDEQGEFLAMVLHELRSPLSSIFGAIECVRDEQDALPSRDWLWTGVDDAMRRVKRLLSDLVGICHATHPAFRLARKPMDLVAAARAAAAQRQADFARHGLKLDLQLDVERAWVIADPDRIELVLGNLLDNAAKYTERGGRVSLMVEVADSEVVLRVRDTGIGIAPDALPMVFEPFVREPVASVQMKSGSGVGLFLVRTLVELHGGTAEASSAGRGCGSEFAVRLPRIEMSSTES